MKSEWFFVISSGVCWGNKWVLSWSNELFWAVRTFAFRSMVFNVSSVPVNSFKNQWTPSEPFRPQILRSDGFSYNCLTHFETQWATFEILYSDYYFNSSKILWVLWFFEQNCPFEAYWLIWALFWAVSIIDSNINRFSDPVRICELFWGTHWATVSPLKSWVFWEPFEYQWSILRLNEVVQLLHPLWDLMSSVFWILMNSWTTCSTIFKLAIAFVT